MWWGSTKCDKVAHACALEYFAAKKADDSGDSYIT